METRAAKVPQRRSPRREKELGIFWLGQAGFLLEWKDHRILIDPYLSDWLATEHEGTEFSHRRLMQSPVDPEKLEDIDWVFATHAHPDHLDPGTLPIVQRNNPRCTFVIPRSEIAAAVKCGLSEERLTAVNADQTVALGTSAEVRGVASAHEDLAVDAAGNFRNLGYILSLGPFTLYHSGDCVPYTGLVEALRKHSIQICLLPVNGRDSFRTSHGIVGNFTLEESIALAQALGAPFLLGHHFGLFDFNTIDPGEGRRFIRTHHPGIAERYVLVEAGVEYHFNG